MEESVPHKHGGADVDLSRDKSRCLCRYQAYANYIPCALLRSVKQKEEEKGPDESREQEDECRSANPKANPQPKSAKSAQLTRGRQVADVVTLRQH